MASAPCVAARKGSRCAWSSAWSHLHRSRRVTGWWVLPLGLLAAALIAVFARLGPDWPAQEFRAWSAAHDGLRLWTDRWYAGSPLPGYSVLYPIVSSKLGAALTGYLSCVTASVAAFLLRPAGSVPRTVGYLLSVALVLCADLLIGQVPFLLGTAAATWALLALVRHRRIAACVLAALASFASPLVGAFLLLAIPALGVQFGWRRAAVLASGVAGIAVSAAVGDGGPFPYVATVFWSTAAFATIAVVLGIRRCPALAVLGATYGLTVIALCAVANPIGGNLARMGQLIALPLLWHVAPRVRWSSQPTIAALATVGAIWSAFPAITAAAHGVTDPSRQAGFYRGINAFLRTQDPRLGRVEVVFTREHWESYFVARHFPLARGWERQTDLRHNAVLYASALSAHDYRRWLRSNAIRFVALPDVPIDYGGRAEAALLRHPPGYLDLVWRDPHWRVWKVRTPHRSQPAPAG